jgi:hypothetical protein
VRTAVALFAAARAQAHDAFAWRLPPYEYEERIMPIDILWGLDGLRLGIDRGSSVDEILAETAGEAEAFRDQAASYLLYA